MECHALHTCGRLRSLKCFVLHGLLFTPLIDLDYSHNTLHSYMIINILCVMLVIQDYWSFKSFKVLSIIIVLLIYVLYIRFFTFQSLRGLSLSSGAILGILIGLLIVVLIAVLCGIRQYGRVCWARRNTYGWYRSLQCQWQSLTNSLAGNGDYNANVTNRSEPQSHIHCTWVDLLSAIYALCVRATYVHNL